MKKVNY